MCYCTPNIRTPFCTSCTPKMQRDINILKEDVSILEDKLKQYECQGDEVVITECTVQYYPGTQIASLFSLKAMPEEMVGKNYVVSIREKK